MFWQAYQNIELANLKDETMHHIGQQLNAWHLKPSGTEGYRVAEVTLGGVDTHDISGKNHGITPTAKSVFYRRGA